MENNIERYVKQLGESKTPLNAKNIKKIHEYIPVPNDHKILWADILSFGGYPAGVVITDKGIVLKCPKKVIKDKNKEIKKENKGKPKEDRKGRISEIYQIVLWEYFSVENYEYVRDTLKDNEDKFYIEFKGEEIAQFSSNALYDFLTELKKDKIEENKKRDEMIASYSSAALDGILLEETSFNAAYGASQSKTGHGIYAEEFGAKLDILHGEQATVVGRDNAKSGPDKIVNAMPVQCKYHKTANSSINACFKKDANGMLDFKYYDLNGKPMKIEVASDQYIKAVDLVKKHILEGRIKGVTNPDAAFDIVRKGKITYKQAVNLAKAGTVESLQYDAINGAVKCLSVLGVSVVVSFAQVFWTTKDYKKAAKAALITGISIYGTSFAGSILASQIARTNIPHMVKPVIADLSKRISPKITTEIINSFRVLAGKKPIYGAAAQKSFIKALNANLITQGIMFVAFSIPDTYRVINKKISVAQYTKNMSSLLSSILFAAIGSAAAGHFIGKIPGEAAKNNVLKAVGSTIGATIGFVGGASVKAVGDLIREDDVIITTRMFNAVLSNRLVDYMITESELDGLIKVLNEKDDELKDLQKGLIKADNQTKLIDSFVEPLLLEIVEKRTKVDNVREEEFENIMIEVIRNGELKYEM